MILSEQGLHTPAGPDGEEVQAAAYALAHHRIEQTPGIDGYILHRHVDRRGEGGLLLGLRRFGRSTARPPTAGRRRSWDTFRVAGTPAFESEAAFALEHAGYDLVRGRARRGPSPSTPPSGRPSCVPTTPSSTCSRRSDAARFEHALQVSQRVVGLPDGGMAESLMLHPLDAASPPPPAPGTWSCRPSPPRS